MPLPMYNKKDSTPSPKIKNVIAVAAGKGGVGKSSVTVNLAYALKYLGYEVGVLDADIYGPSIRKMMPEDKMPSQKGPLITPALCMGIRMISMAYFRKEGEAAVIRAPIANGLIGQFIKNVEWGDLDYLLIDFPPGTGDVQLTLAQQANLTGAVMVTTPQEIALMDVRKAMNMFDQVKIPILGIVENMSYYIHPGCSDPVYIFGQGGGDKLAQETGAPFLQAIPLDPQLCKRADAGEPLFPKGEHIETPTTEAFLSLAKNLAGRIDLLKNQTQAALGDFELVWKE